MVAPKDLDYGKFLAIFSRRCFLGIGWLFTTITSRTNYRIMHGEFSQAIAVLQKLNLIGVIANTVKELPHSYKSVTTNEDKDKRRRGAPPFVFGFLL
jgi:hypothetical protein